MHAIEDNSPNTTGGRAPAERQCGYILSSGDSCHNWALRGHDHCHRHHRWQRARPERPIDIPLLEDEGALIYVLSQTAQALAWGTIPPANGQGVLNVCRLVQTTLTTRLETSKLRYKLRRAGIPEHEIFDDAAPGLDRREPNAERPEDPAATQQEADSAEPTDGRPGELEAPATNPVRTHPEHLRFRDLKKNWDKALQRTENAASEMYLKRFDETYEEFEGSHSTPFEHLAEEDRQLAAEIERAHALAQAQVQAQAEPASAVEAC
jgi:hypothetical protein